MASRRIFVIGATGAQGLPVCRGLVKDGAYSLRILTRDPSSARAQELLKLGDVELVEGTFANEADLRKGFSGCWGAFINIDGFNCGEKDETYWTIRAYELAVELGIKFFVYGGVRYGYRDGGYDPKFRCGHVDAKGRLGEWMLLQRKYNDMAVAIYSTGPYAEMTISSQTVMTPHVEDGVVTWRVPLGDGEVPIVSLDDGEYYVRWLFDHPERSDGMELKVAIEHIGFAALASAFTKVTGKPAKYIDTPADVYFSYIPYAQQPAGYNADPNDPATMTFKDNFSGWWQLWRNSAGNKGVIQRDYALLDEIYPGRIKTAEEFFRREEEKRRAAGLETIFESMVSGTLAPALKLSEDGREGKL
ncbi:NmrA-like family domain-containing protein 1-like protein 3 [Colletotrichum chlorophyti]|uniref:NmrA-like family domain-containing protein 1-like protein 3 n=1 Tax=Colletotrichum chlorophyti TaxID=708187 RepID=A0A1Q8RLQ9_9PEZI|nr:NmrA-like family domain-containing protein 1-like protein 3 [Colletotrichum chlorophyti]